MKQPKEKRPPASKRRSAEITERPQPSPQAAAAAKAAGAKLTPWHPQRLRDFIYGRITLGDLEGISKSAQYEMAKIGYRYLTSGDLATSKKIFLGLSVLDPYDAYFHTVLGSIAQQQEDDAEAIARYSRALQIFPKSPVALANRGEVFLKTGKVAEAAADLLKAVESDPQMKMPSTRRAKVLLDAVKAQAQALASQAKPAAR